MRRLSGALDPNVGLQPSSPSKNELDWHSGTWFDLLSQSNEANLLIVGLEASLRRWGHIDLSEFVHPWARRAPDSPLKHHARRYGRLNRYKSIQSWSVVLEGREHRKIVPDQS